MVSSSLHDSNFSLGKVFSQGSSDQKTYALFSENTSLKDDYKGYDSIQNSDQLEKYIGFRGNFKNITAFA